MATDDRSPDPTPDKPVEDWVTGDEPMTGPQRSYLETLAREAGEEAPGDLTKAQASQEIERLPGDHRPRRRLKRKRRPAPRRRV